MKKLIIGLIVILLLVPVSCAAPPAPMPAPAPAPAPRPAPPPPFQRSVVPEEAYYLPGERVEVTLSIANTSGDTMTISRYPPEVQVAPWLDRRERVLSSRPGGTQPLEVRAGETVTLDFAWDQKDSQGQQASPGWYAVAFKDMNVPQGDRRITFHPTARVLIQHPQGAVEKTIGPEQSQTVNDITVTLERIELNSSGMTVYAFNNPPGYNLPPGQTAPAPSMWIQAEAEYSTDGGAVKKAGSSAIRFLDNGIRHTWNNLDPAPKNDKELSFRILRLSEGGPPGQGFEGPWEFNVHLE